MKKTSIRLSKFVIPERYEISVRPDLEAFVFEGTEVIHLKLLKSTKTITLHSKELNIISAGLANKKTEFAKISYNEENETATLTFTKPLPAGKTKISLHFRGVLSDSLRGFYKSSYVFDNKTQYLATTQFEATDARRAFPCFDEPGSKAIFDITLIVPSGHQAISNTIPIDIKEHDNGYKIVRFSPTPKMSTYLLAFISGEFESIEKKTKKGVLVRVFTTPGKKDQAKFSLDVAVKTLDFFSDYFNIPYPLPVLDMIAIPDFAAGAMENWGAVTYRETQLLIDESNSSAITKQHVAITVTHELAHQWFGNLVTMEWWTHLWLNEGFAAYIEYLAVDFLFPEWDIWTQFVYLDSGAAMQKDALQTTHAIEVDVHHPNEIGEIFDDISYHKGSSIIRMLAGYLGAEDFRKGLQYYLKTHAYKNATTDDLWKAFEKVSGKPVRRMMHFWTRQPGFPLLSIIRKKDTLTLTQNRFFSNRLQKPSNTQKSWPIPISFAAGNQKAAEMLMQKKNLSLPLPQGPIIPKFNVNETGFYRTAYEPAVWEWFIPGIENKTLTPLDRLGLISNAFAVSQAGYLPITTSLRLARAYAGETDYTVWLELTYHLQNIRALVVGTKFYDSYILFARSIIKTIVTTLTWQGQKGEKHTDSLLRALLLQSYGIFGDTQTIQEAKKRFSRAKTNMASLPPDQRGLVFLIVASNGSKKEYGELKKMYIEATLPEEKNRIGRGMCANKDEALLTDALEFSFSKHVRSQDTMRFIENVLANPWGHKPGLTFLMKNWKQYLTIYGEGGHTLSRIVGSLGHLHTTKDAQTIERFFKTHPAPGAERAVKQALEQINANAAWRTQILKELPFFFSKKK